MFPLVELLPAPLQQPLVLGVLEAAWVIGVVAALLLERRPPVSTLAWILVLSLMPVVGIAVYFVLGPRRLDRKKLVLKRLRRDRPAYLSRFEALAPEARTPDEQLARLAVKLDALPPETARAVELHADGDAFYAAVEAAIGAARHHVHAEYYILAPDRTGVRFRDALVAAARRGVHVRLLVDAAGSNRLGAAFFRPLRAAGAQVEWFNPILFDRLRGGAANFRTHRKILVVDGRLGFTGGMNVEDRHSAAAVGAAAWRDVSLRLEGAAVHGLQLAFLEDWAFAIGGTGIALPLGRLDPYFPAEAAGPHDVQVVPSGPDQETAALTLLFPAAFAAARERLWIATPYFVPDEPIAAALAAAALRGVDVRLLLPERTDAWVVDAASRTWHDPLARAGVRIAFHGPAMLHAKTCVVDHALGIVGTANLDNRSLRLNFEVTVLLHGGPPVEALARIFEADFGRARPRRRSEREESFPRRLAASAARLLAPQL